jgi:hypothetical protein
MSRSFFFGINKLVKNDLFFRIPIGISLFGGNAFYSYGTKNVATIEIEKTYIYTKNGFSDFMVIDKMGKHYNVGNNFWFWKWDSIEDWNRLNKNDKIDVKYYGYRIPLLGIFPNIYEIKNQN